jgi:hypothetical protein
MARGLSATAEMRLAEQGDDEAAGPEKDNDQPIESMKDG